MSVSCSCGRVSKYVAYKHLEVGNSRGCKTCSSETRRKEPYRHSLVSKHWMMMRRCYDKDHKCYPEYGGRGIKVDESLHDVEDYITYVKSLPNFGVYNEIDRIDNDKGYEKGNLRWANRGMQNRNHRRNRRVTWNGEDMVITDFITKYTGLSTTWGLQLFRRGVALEELVNRKPRNYGRRAQSIRLGKLRAEESVHDRKIPTDDSA